MKYTDLDFEMLISYRNKMKEIDEKIIQSETIDEIEQQIDNATKLHYDIMHKLVTFKDNLNGCLKEVFTDLVRDLDASHSKKIEFLKTLVKDHYKNMIKKIMIIS